MDVMKVFLFMFTSLIFISSYIKNKDLFSPVKVYIAFSFVFYAGIYFTNVHWETLACYFFIILIIFICLFFEPKVKNNSVRRKKINIDKYITPIWLVSIPGVVVMLSLLIMAGSLEKYFYQLSFRVKDWAGIGYLTIWFSMIPALNLLYFSAIILDKKPTKTKRLLFLIHFIIFIIIGILTASRSFIATNILGMLFVYSYLVAMVKVRYIVTATFLILFFSGVMGAIRNDFGNTQNIESNNSTLFENSHFKYGIIPLELIFSSNIHNLQYGKTYLTVFTNFIPRYIYPDKPDTGGISFTKIYTGNKYRGLSNLATGSITEGIVNFGLVIGVFIGIIFTLLSFLFGCIYYRGFIKRLNGSEKQEQLKVIFYFYIIIAISRLTYSEFTDVIYSIIFSVFIPYFMVSILKNTALTSLRRGNG
ncbi:hypothetical protein [Yersinia ruckeri]|uniref:hypothetical protein n=1 Tax=Yersinia ruckeri TaxID=29486 RepID=UPI0020BDF66C|nr:hypothetical protein [Yersinia ruckeri]EKN4183854.1 hypothetical protein [Yersinia ruckeri]EKN4696648.1 hypothetical protein [Yersinia ruckeri]MCK8554955.1 hypothetical protein [Yersinia ruckeri]MCW6625055.1 hypothetical protein [Yersinia ruckeri]